MYPSSERGAKISTRFNHMELPFLEDQNPCLIAHFMKSILCEFTLIAWGLRVFVTMSCVCGTFNLLLAVSTKHFLYTQFTDGASFFSPWVSRILHWSGGTQADDLYIGGKVLQDARKIK